MNTIKDKLPFHLQRILDEVIGAFNNGDVAHDGVKEIEEWFELEGWDILISDLDDQMAINLCVLSSKCNDDELRAIQYIADDAVLQDSDRIAWVRGLIESALGTGDDSFLLTVHAHTLQATEGKTAVIGCLIEMQGQLGPHCIWQGLHMTKESFLHSLAEGRAYWVTPHLEAIPDKVLLSWWNF
jgi:hypothetical protein